MDSNDIKARIEKTEETIAKKNVLIDKRLTAIGKMYDSIGEFCGAEYNGNIETARAFEETVSNVWKAHQQEVYDRCGEDFDLYRRKLTEGKWKDVEEAYYKLRDNVESIENAVRDVAEKEQLLEKYRKALAEAEQRENVYDTMPDCMKQWMNDMIGLWDAWDKMKRESVKNDRETYWKLQDEQRKAVREHGRDSDVAKAVRREMKEINEQYTQFQWNELPYLDDDGIHDINVKAGRALVTDLYDRVSAITGAFQTADNLKVTRDNKGYAVINGTVTGNGRTAKVQSVGAGGWNIQRFHIRTLVHEVGA